MKLIACIQEDGGLGFEGELLHWFKEDLSNFKKLTKGKIVIMGRKTWESLPKKPLMDRYNVVLVSSRKTGKEISKGGGYPIYNLRTISLISKIAKFLKNEVYIIGGGKLYDEMILQCNEVILTEVHGQNRMADVYFPLDKLRENFTKVSETFLQQDVYLCVYKLNSEIDKVE